MSVDKDLVSVQQARDLVEAAHRPHAEVAQFDQAKIDRICEAMARAALAESARLGAMAVEETGYGIPADKQEKNRFAAEDVWNYFRGLRTKGVVSESKDIVEIASPRGVPVFRSWRQVSRYQPPSGWASIPYASGSAIKSSDGTAMPTSNTGHAASR